MNDNIIKASDKLLEKLQEDLNLCEGEGNKVLDDTYKNKVETAEAKKKTASYQVAMLANSNDERAKQFARLQHKKAISDVYKAKAEKTKMNMINNINKDNISENVITDESMFLLAEEFDKDLLEEEAKVEKVVEPINEGLFAEDSKSKNANKKFDKVQKTKGKLAIKLQQLEAEKENSLGNDKKVQKYELKISTLKNKMAEVDKKYNAADKKLVDLDESIFDEEMSKLDLEINSLLEQIDGEPVETEEDKVDELAKQKDGEIFADASGKLLKSLMINFTSIDDPIIKKIVSNIRSELQKDNCDMNKIRDLKSKLIKFYKK